jgi:hypothetical protein
MSGVRRAAGAEKQMAEANRFTRWQWPWLYMKEKTCSCNRGRIDRKQCAGDANVDANCAKACCEPIGRCCGDEGATAAEELLSSAITRAAKPALVISPTWIWPNERKN